MSKTYKEFLREANPKAKDDKKSDGDDDDESSSDEDIKKIGSKKSKTKVEIEPSFTNRNS